MKVKPQGPGLGVSSAINVINAQSLGCPSVTCCFMEGTAGGAISVSQWGPLGSSSVGVIGLLQYFAGIEWGRVCVPVPPPTPDPPLAVYGRDLSSKLVCRLEQEGSGPIEGC
ncbi:Hypothetical predicted protein [Podarcis lilfordi]|uniref:Uncharacterized protein n=1 Tax=Podarcis lilfordi TaxID=74358 RepID=A0AA35PDS2_9SAUR|nr:Hypothetical predicted protein [Podarcis lilfordi]